jgi:hypothetical protein
MHDRILQAIFRVIDEINLQRPKRSKLAKSEGTALAELDSLGMANFLVLAEQEINKEFGRGVNLLEEGSLVDGFERQTIGSAVGIIERLLERDSDD